METTRIKWVPSFEAFPKLLNISKGDGPQFSNQGILARKYQIFLQRVLLDRYEVVPRGVVHAGGHFGEELFEYLLLGFTKVLVVEPNPQVFDNLDNTVRTLNEVFKEVISFFQADHLVQVPAIRAINCALSDTNGTCDLLITEDSMLTSMLLPKDDKFEEDDKFEGGTQRVRVSHTVSVATQTLDHLLATHCSKEDVSRYNYFRLNIQGAELLALKGAKNSLSQFDIVISEVNLTERYQGSPTPNALDEFMVGAGFEMKHRLCDGNVCNVAYIRASLTS